MVSLSGRQKFVLFVPAVENQPNVFKDEIKEEIAGKKAFDECCDRCDH